MSRMLIDDDEPILGFDQEIAFRQLSQERQLRETRRGG